jgi:hypothetical protein
VFNYSPAKRLSQYEKTVQSALVETLVISAENPSGLSKGVSIKLKALLEKIKEKMKMNSRTATDALTISHCQALSDFITLWENEKNNSLINTH